MALDQEFDLEGLAAPLTEPSVGIDLRQDGGGLFFRLKDLRSDARAVEREAVAAPEQDTPLIEAGRRIWLELAELATGALRDKTKDLEIAAWLCEAEVRLNGFDGLTDGLALLQRLLDDYWDDGLYPRADEDGVATRVAPIGNLLGLEGVAALLQPIRLLPLSDTARDVALWTVETAFAPIQGSDSGARERLQVKRSEQVEAIRQGLFRASPEFLRRVHHGARKAIAQVEALAASVDRHADVGRFGSQVTAPLNDIIELLENQVGDRLVDPVTSGDEPDESPTPGGGAVHSAPPPGSGEIANREQAYASILNIADFFERSEPQSLLAQSLREVVRRGRMPLDALLAELLPDATQRTLFLQRAGVKDANAVNENGGFN